MKDDWLKPIKLRASAIAPRAYDRLQRWVWTRRYGRIHDLVRTHHGSRVVAGPFAGMAYLDRAAGSLVLPKLLGTYEAELHRVIEREVLETPYAVVIDVGCAEGYYAVGLARRLPAVPVIAYDTDDVARALCGQLAALNGVVDRVDLRRACEWQELKSLAGRRALIVCDCEGYESQLLCDAVVPYLADSALLVELHDFLVPGVTDVLSRRLAATHDVRLIAVEPRDPDAYPSMAVIPGRHRRRAMDEGRPRSQRWLWARPKLPPG